MFPKSISDEHAERRQAFFERGDYCAATAEFLSSFKKAIKALAAREEILLTGNCETDNGQLLSQIIVKGVDNSIREIIALEGISGIRAATYLLAKAKDENGLGLEDTFALAICFANMGENHQTALLDLAGAWDDYIISISKLYDGKAGRVPKNRKWYDIAIPYKEKYPDLTCSALARKISDDLAENGVTSDVRAIRRGIKPLFTCD